ncbi:TNT domain-containing protein [Actinokineospora sp. NBRC 105648]|uniref:TNT domain-containing protein n=1 Tax=Actinokineospora sp. NBRC 105648 TaxID=3032206 RepID=UPI0024A57EAF|nr:TNT domain-containing protein [Actinokineospora sp. NBRC 105648]GLZ41395.1 hypothetical protein Acsp05_50190 [Actinokineospora sp. NBRC 105648]
MHWTRRLGVVLAGLLTVFATVTPVAAQAAPASLTECSTELYQGDRRLGPQELPLLGQVGLQLLGYNRSGYRPTEQFLAEYYDAGTSSWRYPPQDGYVLDHSGAPVKWSQSLRPGTRMDRYGSEYGSFLAPTGLPYTTRSIPPSNLVGTPAAGCNYHDYRVLKAFTVYAGPIAPWFYQTGGGLQYQLNGTLIPGAPATVNVLWLIDNGYLQRLR